MSLFSGMRVFENSYCELLVPIRKHKRRRSQSVAYHARIQKKWRKRFGTKADPAAFIFDPAAIGMPGSKAIFAHPECVAILRNIGN